MGGSAGNTARYAIQSWYKLQIDGKNLRMSCDEVIKIPLCLSIIDGSKKMIPCVVITTENNLFNDEIKIEIETNEGFTIEPIRVTSHAHLAWVHILTLPPKTTGLKNVKVFASEGDYTFSIQNNLTFEIMKPPYDYTGAALDSVSEQVEYNEEVIRGLEIQLDDLTARVEALEQKP